ncbi:MAG TPA: hypothetical protein DCQ31_14100 [Bacteroidales bacterium]|nr:hypothetical protein [Bacteroidales bacterium]
MAIYLTAFISAAKRLFVKILLPVSDILLTAIGFTLVTKVWESIKFHNSDYFHEEVLLQTVPGFIAIWLVTLWFLGSYKAKSTLIQLVKALLVGSGLVLITYALLPEKLRFSRAVIVFSAAWVLLALPIFRIILQQFGLLDFKLKSSSTKKVIIAGTDQESQRVVKILANLATKFTVLGRVGQAENKGELPLLSSFENLSEVYRINKPDEIIFCLNDVNSSEIIKTIVLMASEPVSFKIAAYNSTGIIGSNSSNESGELYIPEVNSVLSESNLALKRSFDIIFATLLLLFFPFYFFIFQQKKIALRNCFFVLLGRKTWVRINLPNSLANRLKPGVLEYTSETGKPNNYIRNYSVWLDFITLATNFTRIDKPTNTT